MARTPYRPLRGPCCHAERCAMPPSPGLLQKLLESYRQALADGRLAAGTTFKRFIDDWALSHRGTTVAGQDDGHLGDAAAPAAARATAPVAAKKPLHGVVRTLVLLVDFEDRPHRADLTAEHYRRMMFGLRRDFPSGSLRQYYRDVSHHDTQGHGVDVQGEVHGWYRLPHPLSHYTHHSSGMGGRYPNNAQAMALDAVHAAMKAGVDFSGFDALGDQRVTALIIVHAGLGGEETGRRSDLWSHKWTVPGCPQVAPGLRVSTYLTVPENCTVGVVAHEWGHLAARWADYYDTGADPATTSNGLGQYCLMAAGAWGGGGLQPSLPNAMLRLSQGWTVPRRIDASTAGLVLKPAAEGGGCLLIHNPRTMTARQSILVEYRRRRLQDSHLPDEGIAVYVVDEAARDEDNENHLEIELLQADGKRDLAAALSVGNSGDSGDLYPFRSKRTLGRQTKPALVVPHGKWSGVTIKVHGKPGDDQMVLDVAFDAA
jgi:immune inhibitor A